MFFKVMATSLLTDSEKNGLELIMDDLHATWARTVTAYKDEERVVIITNPNYNPLYDTGGGTTESITKTAVSKTFSVRIQYQDDITKNYWSDSNVNSQLKIENAKGLIRIKLYDEDYNWLKEAKRMDVDGKRFSIDSSFKGHGLFDNKFYTIFLKPAP
jgi:hypothetical protein